MLYIASQETLIRDSQMVSLGVDIQLIVMVLQLSVFWERKNTELHARE